MKVLIVDDKEPNRYLLRALLEGNGCTVDEARHGAEALVKARQSPPQLIISDLLMPVMDGYTLLRHWKADDRLKVIPFIVYTATYTEPKDERLALDLGADAFILKPTEPEPFMARIHEVLAKSKCGELSPTQARMGEEKALLKNYSEVLIRKLEEKALQLTEANRALQQDIVERKQAEAALRLAHERLRRLVDSNIVGIVIADATGTIFEANDYYLRLVGYTREEFEQGKVDWRAITPPEWLPVDEQGLQELCERGACTPYEKEYVRRDGTRVAVLLADAMLPGPGEQIAAFVLDLSDRKRLEQERLAMEVRLRHQQKLESIGTLAGGVAHEINNPINGIMNYAQLIQDRLPADNPLTEYTGEILHETQRVATIVRNLLTFSQSGKQSHSPARMADIIEGTMSLIRTVIQHDQITLTVNVAEDLPELNCRSQQLQQVVMNLMTNARDALNERYPGHDPDKVLNVSAHLVAKDEQCWIRMTVEDHGTGITPEARERMFDPFFTTKPRDKGTGLGLAISHGIVKEHHGKLTVETEPGKFTRMHLDLPVDAGENAGTRDSL